MNQNVRVISVLTSNVAVNLSDVELNLDTSKESKFPTNIDPAQSLSRV